MAPLAQHIRFPRALPMAAASLAIGLAAAVAASPSPVTPAPATARPVAVAEQPVAPKKPQLGYSRRGGLKNLPPALLETHKKLVAHKAITYKALQALADAGDPIAAYTLAGRLETSNDTSLLPAAAHYYSMAAYNGRIIAVRPLVSLLDASGLEFNDKVLKSAQDALEIQAQHRNPEATTALIRFYGAKPIFGSNPKRLRYILAKAAKSGDGKAALDLAIAVMSSGKLTEAGKADALKYLQLARHSDNLGIQTMAENFIRQVEAPASVIQASTQVKP
jgi:hypothetical protein